MLQTIIYSTNSLYFGIFFHSTQCWIRSLSLSTFLFFPSYDADKMLTFRHVLVFFFHVTIWPTFVLSFESSSLYLFAAVSRSFAMPLFCCSISHFFFIHWKLCVHTRAEENKNRIKRKQNNVYKKRKINGINEKSNMPCVQFETELYVSFFFFFLSFSISRKWHTKFLRIGWW